MLSTKPPRDEDQLEEWCCDEALAHGYMSAKLDQLKKDWPDRGFFGHGADAFFVEFKMPGEHPRARQKAVLNSLKAKGFETHVVRTVHEFAALRDSFRTLPDP